MYRQYSFFFFFFLFSCFFRQKSIEGDEEMDGRLVIY